MHQSINADSMDAITARIEVIRNFHGEEFRVPVEVWEAANGEGIVGRATDNVFSRAPAAIILLLAVDEDPELDEHEMGVAKNALWAAKNQPAAN